MHKRDGKDNEIHQKLGKKDTLPKRAVEWDENFLFQIELKFYFGHKSLKYPWQPKLSSLALVGEVFEHFRIELCTISEKKQFQVLFQGQGHQYSKKDGFTSGTQETSVWAIIRFKINF